MYLVETQKYPQQPFKPHDFKCRTLKEAEALAKAYPCYRVRIVRIIKGKRTVLKQG